MSNYFGVPYIKVSANFDDPSQESYNDAYEESRNFALENGIEVKLYPYQDSSYGRFVFKFVGNLNDSGNYEICFNGNKIIELNFLYSSKCKLASFCSYSNKENKYIYYVLLASGSANMAYPLDVQNGTDLDPDTGEIDTPEYIPPIEKPNSVPPVILDIADITTYAGRKLLLQFYSYDSDGFVTQFYFSLDGGQGYARMTPKNIGGHAYVNTFLFKELAEYTCKIKVCDNEGLSSESNEFKIKVLPNIYDDTINITPPKVSNSSQIIIYDKRSNEFESNGLGILKDCISCTVENELNGMYEVELSYPIGTKFDDYLLDTEYIIKCNVDNFSNSQLFRIYSSEYIMEDNIITIRARHITYDLKGNFVEGLSFIYSSCEDVANGIITNSTGSVSKKFVVKSDIERKKNFSIAMANTQDAILGIDGSVLDIYGTKDTIIKRDNFNINISNSSIDKGFLISYRKNLINFKRNINIEGVITKIYPYFITDYGKIVTLKEKFIASKNATNYANEKIECVEFTGDISTENDLREEALKYFTNNQVDVPSINYEVDFAILRKNDSELSILEKVSLGDIVTVNDEKIGLNVKARVIKIIYNVISKKYQKIELGNFKNEYRISKKQERQRIINNVRTFIK